MIETRTPETVEDPNFRSSSPSIEAEGIPAGLDSFSFDASPPASLSTLPPELQRKIVELEVPHSFHSVTYGPRQSILRALCLVSRRFRAIAQPLLFEIVEIWTERQCQAWEVVNECPETGDDLSRNVRSLVFCFDEKKVEKILRGLTMLREVTLYNILLTDNIADALSSLAHLTSLQLAGSGASTTTHFPLLNLRSLTLREVSDALMMALLIPEMVPKLEVLALIPEDLESESSVAVQDSLIGQLLPQLSAIFFTIEAWSDEATFLRSAAERALIDFGFPETDDLLNPEAMIVNARWDGDDYRMDVLEELEDLTSSLAHGPRLLPLRRLYFDTSHLTYRNPTEEVRQSIENLRGVCRQRKIEFVDEPSYTGYILDPYISPDFLRFQQDLQRKS